MSTLTPPQPPVGSFMPEGARTPEDTHTNESAAESPLSTGKTRKAVKAAQKVDLQNLPDLLTISEVSSLLRVSPLTIKRWGKRGKLPAIRINSRGDRRYKKQAVLWMLGMSE